MKGGLPLDVMIGKAVSVFKLLAGEDQALLVGRNPEGVGKRQAHGNHEADATYPSLS